MLALTLECLGDVTILHCAGRIVAGKEADLLRKAVLCQLDGGTVVLDLAQVGAVDGGGIGTLVFLHASAGTAGTEFKLMNPTHSVRELLEVTHLDSVFDISASDAADSCEPVADDTAA